MSLIIISGSPGIKRKFFAKEINPQAEYRYCFNDFSLPRVDVGMLTDVEFKQDYQALVEWCTGDKIIGGTFSRVFLERIRNDVDNVQVLNIVRHPTASFISAAPNMINDELPMGINYVTPLSTSSAIDNITLSKLDYVTTVKFEDIIANKSFEFNGLTVQCPSVHTNYNNIITKYESVILKRNTVITGQLVDKFNKLFSNFNQSFVNCHNDSRLPENIFKELGYELKTYQEILNESV
jgi:hypothetical protein